MKKKMLEKQLFCYRAELEAQYAKGLSKLSNKLTKTCAKDQGKIFSSLVSILTKL